MKKVILLLAFICCFAVAGGEKFPKYIILFIGDGMTYPQRMTAEEFVRKNGGKGLAMNHMPCHATTRSCSANSIVTDSAASGTAIACGRKTNNGRIGVDSSGKVKLESTAEFAARKGWKVGIVSTMVINHATPASFFGHRSSRSMYYELGLDMINSGFDYFAGGGINQKSRGYKGPQRADLYELARKKGYKTLNNRKEFLALKPGCGKIIYSASPGYMPAVIDTPQNFTALAEMTAKGIELLKNPKGFFLMVEGGTIDSCGHYNEAAGNLREVLALDEAVKAAVKFAEKHPDDTLIVVTGDHETGGMTMGCAATGYAMYPERLANQKCSAWKFAGKVKAAQKKNPALSFDAVKKMLSDDFGFNFKDPKSPMGLNSAQLKLLEDGFKKKRIESAVKNVINQKAGIGWTTSAHTALPVLTTSYGVQGKRFTGFIENTDISVKLKEIIR